MPQRDRLAVVIDGAVRDFVLHTRLSGEIAPNCRDGPVWVK